jgi:hypothetical protein
MNVHHQHKKGHARQSYEEPMVGNRDEETYQTESKSQFVPHNGLESNCPAEHERLSHACPQRAENHNHTGRREHPLSDMEVLDRTAVQGLEFGKLVGDAANVGNEWNQVDEEDEAVQLALLFEPLKKSRRHLQASVDAEERDGYALQAKNG